MIGFDHDGPLTGGIQTTGNYPGKATTPEQLMADIDEVLKVTPGCKKLNLHASYAIFEDGEFVDRDKIEPKHFKKWVEFAKERGMGLDFNPHLLLPSEDEGRTDPVLSRTMRSAISGSSTARPASGFPSTSRTRPAFPVS